MPDDTTHPRYRIDGEGALWQRVKPGPHTPGAGERRLGLVVTADWYPSDADHITLHYTPEGHIHATGRAYVAFTNVDDQAGILRGYTTGPGAGADASGAPSLVQVKVVDRRGPIVLVERPGGERVYLVLCPHCGTDLSTCSMGRILVSPAGPLPELWHPVRCPECKGALLPLPEVSHIVPASHLPRQ